MLTKLFRIIVMLVFLAFYSWIASVIGPVRAPISGVDFRPVIVFFATTMTWVFSCYYIEKMVVWLRAK